MYGFCDAKKVHDSTLCIWRSSNGERLVIPTSETFSLDDNINYIHSKIHSEILKQSYLVLCLYDDVEELNVATSPS